jgi:hypothetical protein
MNCLKNILIVISLVFIGTSCTDQKTIELFDGETLEGWEGAKDVFRVENGCIIGGSLENGLEESYYLCTTEEYSDFELSLSVKLIHENLNGNSGISFRAKRIPGSNMLASYQADIGYINPSIVAYFSDEYKPLDTISPYSLWGGLLDEGRAESSRYLHPETFPVAVLKLPGRELINSIVKPYDWNEIQIRALGKEIEIKINGSTTIKFTETSDLPTKGSIGLQAHDGDPYEVHFKNITIKRLS